MWFTKWSGVLVKINRDKVSKNNKEIEKNEMQKFEDQLWKVKDFGTIILIKEITMYRTKKIICFLKN